VKCIPKTLTTLQVFGQTQYFFPVKDIKYYEIGTTKGKLQQINSGNEFSVCNIESLNTTLNGTYYFCIILILSTSLREVGAPEYFLLSPWTRI